MFINGKIYFNIIIIENIYINNCEIVEKKINPYKCYIRFENEKKINKDIIIYEKSIQFKK